MLYEITTLIPFLFPKMITALICGLIIGYDRELKRKSAGVRTFILICSGVTLFTSLSFYIADVLEGIDPTRIIGQIITGIGFLGAGVIVKNDNKIEGVTTAAFIWCISAIGVLIGLGSTITPILLSFGLMVVTKSLESFEKYIKTKNEDQSPS